VIKRACCVCVCKRYLQEYTALGTAGGMYHFRDQILTGNPELFFVMNADVCGDFPLQEMLEFHRSLDPQPHFTILGTEVLLALRLFTFIATNSVET
jgi:NDP-sugar pyrophosphorylase family protein